ncbi:LAETG motif-containing sortase-dependent surface protein [Streptomyces sp. CG1]|uniref:LAETG motif-containing sortase-dependent surface protein n=1 Tax=Streptomyces sp. CG1 TaxID=1287523 RepID=UPI0034E199F5
MKLRRALVAVATTAAVAPAALTMATVAYADDGSASATPTASAGVSASAAPADTSSSGATATATANATGSAAPSAPTDGAPVASASAVPTGTPTAEPTDLGFCEDQNPHYKATLRMTLSGLPGKVVKGSGWHPFKMTVSNPSKDAIKDITLAAGVGPLNGDNPFTLKQVVLQAYDPDAKQWFDVTDDGTYSFGSLGPGDLPGNSAVDLGFRLNVTAKAPVGKALTIGLGVYPDTKNNCEATGFAAYKIDIVKPGTRTTGSSPVPQTGGEAPLPSKAPAKNGTSHVVPVSDTTAASKGSLAHTGTSSALPLIAGIGGAAVVVGAGAVFVVRRRKSGGAAA